MSEHKDNRSFTIQDTFKAKCIAILLLIFHHMFNDEEEIVQNCRIRFIECNTIVKAAVNARVCVWIFVFLSAYGITISYMRGMTSRTPTAEYRVRFFWHRVLMLQKIYFPTVIIQYVVLLLTKPSSELILNPLYVVTNFLGIADILNFPKLTGLYWYISFTLLLILFFPLFYDICERYSYLTIPIVSVLTLGYMGEGIHSHNGGLYLQYISAVFAGIIFAQKNVWYKLKTQLPSFKSFIRFIVLLMCAIIFPIIRNSSLQDILMYKQVLMTGTAIAVCWIACCYCSLSWLSKLMIFIGKHSGNMYLLHLLVLYHMKGIIYYSKNIVVSFMSCVIISLLFSVALSFILKRIGYYSLIKKIDGKIIP